MSGVICSKSYFFLTYNAFKEKKKADKKKISLQ